MPTDPVCATTLTTDSPTTRHFSACPRLLDFDCTCHARVSRHGEGKGREGRTQGLRRVGPVEGLWVGIENRSVRNFNELRILVGGLSTAKSGGGSNCGQFFSRRLAGSFWPSRRDRKNGLCSNCEANFRRNSFTTRSHEHNTLTPSRMRHLPDCLRVGSNAKSLRNRSNAKIRRLLL